MTDDREVPLEDNEDLLPPELTMASALWLAGCLIAGFVGIALMILID